MEREAEPLHYDSHYLWPDETQGPWRLQLHWDFVDHRWALTGLTIRSCFDATTAVDATSEDRTLGDAGHVIEGPKPGRPQELSSRELRALHLADITRREESGWQRLLVETGRARIPPTGSGAGERHEGPGRPPLYDEGHFAEVARVYSEAYQNQPRNPTMKVAKDFRVSRSTAAKWVARARQLGFLAGTRKRVAGGVSPAPIHIVRLSSDEAPPYVRFSGSGGRRFVVWVSCPSEANLTRLTRRVAVDPETAARIRQLGAARSLVDYFGHPLSPAEDALLRLFSAHRTGSAFWHAVDEAGLRAQDKGAIDRWG